MSAPRKLRCAIYTRKSTSEGLEKDFNTLEAQRESASAYIASQKHEGWIELVDQYDDGGFSGGNLNRPALQRLIEDVESGYVDVVVVYKIDRISRSLSDFCKLVEVFEKRKVAFVSVTQAFNTTTAMGRLILTILFAFAQFERELGSERVRDKVALSRAKGMWMGGMVPLGYDLIDKRLVVNPMEASQIVDIFNQYGLIPSMTGLMAHLDSQGSMTKS
jgi:DNA invertase Pin-like site-specific DNA recombinase